MRDGSQAVLVLDAQTGDVFPASSQLHPLMADNVAEDVLVLLKEAKRVCFSPPLARTTIYSMIV
jgi:hypothetical protein